MKLLVILLCFLNIAFLTNAQKVRLEGDDSPYLCKNDSIAEQFSLELRASRVDSLITVLYDYDNGRMPDSRSAIIWVQNGISKARIIEGCDSIIKDSILTFDSPIWDYIKTARFEDISIPIKSAYSQSHDHCYSISVEIPQRKFIVVVRNYERKNDSKNKVALQDTRVILTNMIDNLLN